WRSSAADSANTEIVEILGELTWLRSTSEHELVNTTEEHAEHRERVAVRMLAFEVDGKEVEQRRERSQLFFAVVLVESQVLAHEHAGVADGAGQRQHLEQLDDVRAETFGTRAIADARAQHLRAEPA